MNSLQELNNFGGVALDFTDNRPSIVKFDRITPIEPLNRGFTITSLAEVITPGIEIAEIVNYSTANVRYQVTLFPGDATPLTGSSISFSNVPAHVTSSTVGNVYTLTGLRSIDDWLAVRQFTWNLPANYASKPFYHLEVKIIYYDSALASDKFKSFLAFDFRFFKFAQLQATATITRASLTGNQRTTAAMTSSSALTCQVATTVGLLSQTTSSAFSLSATLNPLIKSLPTSVNYTSNNENNIFSVTTPVVGDSNPSTTSTFDVILTSSLGTFSTSSTTASVSPLTITGSLATVNSALANVKFYSPLNTSSNGTFTFELKRDSVTQITKTINLVGTSGSYSSVTYTFTSSTLWTPTNADSKYANATIYVVGGGGGGRGENYLYNNAYGGAGGGGGGYVNASGLSINVQSYTISVGQGGAGQQTLIGNAAQSGGSSSALGYTAGGGGAATTFDGGSSGTPQSFIGGTFGSSSTSAGTVYFGGGGGGASAVGGNGNSSGSSGAKGLGLSVAGFDTISFGGRGSASSSLGPNYGVGNGGNGRKNTTIGSFGNFPFVPGDAGEAGIVKIVLTAK